MGATNNIIQQFFSNNERFADLINGYVGDEMLTPSDLEEKDSQLIAKAGTKPYQKTLGKYRDIIRKVAIGMDFVLIGIENQTEINYAMPIRTMMYDAISYDEQLRTIMKHTKKQKGLSSAEFLGGFRKNDMVIPVFTLVLYFGAEPWNGTMDLYGIMDLERMPKKIRNLIHNYPVNLLQINSFEDVECFKTDLKAVFGFLQNSSTQEKLETYINQNQNDFEHLQEDAYDVIIQLTDSKELIEYKKNKREAGYNMCNAIQEMIKNSKMEGKNIGVIEGEVRGESRILRLTSAMVEDNCANQIMRLSTDRCFLEEMLSKYNI